MKLNDKSLTPLYQQVLGDLKAQVISGAYQPGDKLPSEAELSERYSVSRVTVRRALDELANEGYLTSRQGKGTFVNQRKLTRKLSQTSDVRSFTDLCADMGMAAGARMLERSVVPAGAKERELFGEDCRQLAFVSRLRTADGIPIMEEDNYFPYEGFEFLLEEDLDDLSIFGLVRTRTGRSPERCAESTIEITLADARMAGLLEICAGDPLFFEHVFFLDQEGRPVCLSNKYLVGSRYQFNI